MAASPPFVHSGVLALPEYKELDDPSTDKKELVTKIISPLTTAIEDGANARDVLAGPLWNLWAAVVAKVASTPHEHHHELASFIIELSKLPQLKNARGENVEVDEMPVWPSLPYWQLAIAEYFNNFGLTLDKTEEQQHWINFNAFLARLTSEITDPVDVGMASPLNFAFNSVTVFREVLEEGKQVQQYKLDTLNVWLQYAGPRLQEWSEQRKHYSHKKPYQGSAVVGKDWNGFSKERWDYWMSQMKDLDANLH